MDIEITAKGNPEFMSDLATSWPTVERELVDGLDPAFTKLEFRNNAFVSFDVEASADDDGVELTLSVSSPKVLTNVGAPVGAFGREVMRARDEMERSMKQTIEAYTAEMRNLLDGRTEDEVKAVKSNVSKLVIYLLASLRKTTAFLRLDPAEAMALIPLVKDGVNYEAIGRVTHENPVVGATALADNIWRPKVLGLTVEDYCHEWTSPDYQEMIREMFERLLDFIAKPTREGAAKNASNLAKVVLAICGIDPGRSSEEAADQPKVLRWD